MGLPKEIAELAERFERNRELCLSGQDIKSTIKILFSKLYGSYCSL
jgi:hypothetical protein